jgi:hypothetical protein
MLGSVNRIMRTGEITSAPEISIMARKKYGGRTQTLPEGSAFF